MSFYMNPGEVLCSEVSEDVENCFSYIQVLSIDDYLLRCFRSSHTLPLFFFFPLG